MPRFLYSYLEMFSVLGDGTPENPGGDFSMCCWIEAENPTAALDWGYVLLGDYYRARFAYEDDEPLYDGTPIRQGELETDAETLAAAEARNYPCCRVGEIPDWKEPWRPSNGNP